MKNDLLKIYRLENSVFTFKDISLLWQETNPDLVKARVNYYVRTKQLYHLRRGIYARDENYNKLELAIKIYTPSYISLETVLQKEGIIFQFYKNFFVVSYLTREISCDGQVYSYKKIKDAVLINLEGIEKQSNFYIASKERAFLDTLYLFQNYHFDNLTLIDWEKCRQMVKIYDNKSLAAAFNSYYRKFKNVRS